MHACTCSYSYKPVNYIKQIYITCCYPIDDYNELSVGVSWYAPSYILYVAIVFENAILMANTGIVLKLYINSYQ